MSKLDIAISHELTKKEALRRIKSLLGQLEAEHHDMIREIEQEWSGESGRFRFYSKGYTIRGKIFVEKDKVSLTAQLPLMLSFLKGKISTLIKEKTHKVLSA